MKKLFLTLILSLLLFSVYAQRLKYKDVFDVVVSGDEILAYNILLEYQRQDPYFANTYFQLGNLAYKWAFEADPFLDIERVDYFIYNTRLYYGLAKKHISDDKSEVRKNRKYYSNVPQLAKIDKLQQEDVLNFIDQRLKEIDVYDKQVHKIYSYFYRMVNNYNHTVEFYREILAKYNKLKDIYMAPYTTDVKPLLDTLSMLFDSTMLFYQQYKTSITSYPIKHYNQQLKLRDILTYRLEGITNANFLSDTIVVWNYGKWINDVRAVIVREISKLRSQIYLTQKKMQKFERQVLKGPYSDDNPFFKLEQKVIYEIEKYNYKSLMSAYFTYYKGKLDYLTFSKFKYNDTTDTRMKLVARARNYKVLRNYKQTVDSLLDIVVARNKPENRYKYRDFIAAEFPDGFDEYLKGQKKWLQDYLDKQMERFKFFIFRDALNYPFVKDSVQYKNYYIPLYVEFVKPQLAQVNQVVVLDKAVSPQGDVYVGGYIRQGSSSNAFIARVYQGQVQWIKVNPGSLNTFSYVVKLFLSPDGIAAVVHSESQDTRKNWILQLDFLGKQKYMIQLQEQAMPRFLSYDDINNLFVVAFKGDELMPLLTGDRPLTVEQWDIGSKKMKWSASFDINGSLIDIVKIDTMYYVYANALSYKDLDGQVHQTQDNSVIQMKIGFSGKVYDIKPVIENDLFFGIKAIKLSNRQINLLGLASEPVPVYSRNFLTLPRLKYFLVNREK